MDNLKAIQISLGIGIEKVFNISELNLNPGMYNIYTLDEGGDLNSPITFGILRIHNNNLYCSFISIASSKTSVKGYLETTNESILLKFTNEESYIRNRRYTIYIKKV